MLSSPRLRLDSDVSIPIQLLRLVLLCESSFLPLSGPSPPMHLGARLLLVVPSIEPLILGMLPSHHDLVPAQQRLVTLFFL